MSSSSSSSSLEQKALRIEAVLAQPTINLWELRELALSEGGLISDSIRQRAWPALVGLYTQAAAAILQTDDDQEEEEEEGYQVFLGTTRSPRDDFLQVELDVARCTWHLLTGTQRMQRLQMEYKRNKRIARVIKKKQRKLAACIEQTLEAAPRARYYQGYHDVACIFLATLKEAASPRAWMPLYNNNNQKTMALPSAVLLKVSQSHLVDCMQETFQPLQTCLCLTIFPLLAFLDQEVHAHLAACDLAPFFALPWVLTWFAHEIRDTSAVKRLFDAFIGSHPAFPLYVCVAMLLHPYNRSQILEAECDFACLHHVLSGLPKNSNSVGWKYQPGTGYVSDHEDDGSTTSTTTTGGEHDNEEDSIRSTAEDEDSIFTGDNTIDGEMVLLQAGILDEHNKHPEATSSMTESVSVSTSMSRTTTTTEEQKVPFQELLDMAVQLMHRVPPRKLLGLATSYHGTEYVQELLGDGPLPALLQNPPPWVYSPTAPAEWWLRDKAREARGLPPRPEGTRHNQLRLQQLLHPGSTATNHTLLPKSVSVTEDYVRIPHQYHVKMLRQLPRGARATVASGMALSVSEEKREQSRKRRLALLASVLVAVFAWQISLSLSEASKSPLSPEAFNSSSSEPLFQEMVSVDSGPEAVVETSMSAAQSDPLEAEYCLATEFSCKAYPDKSDGVEQLSKVLSPMDEEPLMSEPQLESLVTRPILEDSSHSSETCADSFGISKDTVGEHGPDVAIEDEKFAALDHHESAAASGSTEQENVGSGMENNGDSALMGDAPRHQELLQMAAR